MTLTLEKVLDSVGEGEGGMIWENGIEIRVISYMERVASPGSRFAFLWPIQMTQSQIVRAVSWEGYRKVCILLVSPFTL